ncbi:hypothetical protein GALMADRAFT_714582 [Galerina marginata CBS 339.88]|uniref:Uncharacterized protein n=1 Tax=Galerina marginata (strain CBS 339.88) TaxID=685588 RepID=A0A067TX03_GALM3|nr:hypothetical protein GALMADRAFT_714582 [Galerina marginata CBS 339.88]
MCGMRCHWSAVYPRRVTPDNYAHHLGWHLAYSSNFSLFLARFGMLIERPGAGQRCRKGTNETSNNGRCCSQNALALLCWDYLEGGSKSIADCLDFDENFELGKI